MFSRMVQKRQASKGSRVLAASLFHILDSLISVHTLYLISTQLISWPCYGIYNEVLRDRGLESMPRYVE